MMSYRKKTRNDNNVPSDRQSERKERNGGKKRKNKKEETCSVVALAFARLWLFSEVFYGAGWDDAASRRYYIYTPAVVLLLPLW
jgi:hypothetical protein